MHFQRPHPFLSCAIGLLLSSVLHAEPIKAVAWNIEWYPGGRPNASKGEQHKQYKGVSEQLVKMNPDIFLAQEVTDAKAFEKLASSIPGMKVDVFSNFLEPDGKTPGPQQCAIASRLKAHSAWFESFKPTENLPSLRRGFAFAALEHPELSGSDATNLAATQRVAAQRLLDEDGPIDWLHPLCRDGTERTRLASGARRSVRPGEAGRAHDADRARDELAVARRRRFRLG